MPSLRAQQLCPDLIFRKPRFDIYREVSQQIRAIFRDYTPHVEPLSLDEAYLDVTEDLKGIGSATRIAELIRQRIRQETHLTASAGVSYNKFLAKLASDQNKPDGLCVIRPGQGAAFVAKLPVRRFHGVGPRGAEKMAKLGIETGADLREKDIAFLKAHFGSFRRLSLSRRARDRPAPRARQPPAQIAGGRAGHSSTISLPAVRSTKRWTALPTSSGTGLREAQARGRTVTLKLRYTDFRLVTRARSLTHFVSDKAEFVKLGHDLLDEMLPLPLPIRLMGLTLSALEGEESEKPAKDTAQLSLL